MEGLAFSFCSRLNSQLLQFKLSMGLHPSVLLLRTSLRCCILSWASATFKSGNESVDHVHTRADIGYELEVCPLQAADFHDRTGQFEDRIFDRCSGFLLFYHLLIKNNQI
jgi:hypothetical protein